MTVIPTPRRIQPRRAPAPARRQPTAWESLPAPVRCMVWVQTILFFIGIPIIILGWLVVLVLA